MICIVLGKGKSDPFYFLSYEGQFGKLAMIKTSNQLMQTIHLADYGYIIRPVYKQFGALIINVFHDDALSDVIKGFQAITQTVMILLLIYWVA